VVADDQVADAADEDAEGQTDGGRIHHLEEPVAEPAHQRVSGDDGTGDPADQADAAPPDRQHVAERFELAEVTDHIEQPGTDDSADQRPQEERADVVVGQAALPALPEHPPRPGQVAGGDADPVRRDGERPQPDAVQDRPPEHGKEVHGERVYPRTLGETAALHPSATAPPRSSPPTTSAG
jgi:hypothetical protein